MPCNGDYLDPNQRERELQRAAKLLQYVLSELKIKVPPDITLAAKNEYCDSDYVPDLCSLLKKLTPKLKKKIIYNPKVALSRELANWWEDHQAADKEREREERQNRIDETAKQKALQKLTAKERRLLGLPL